jgi:hypothetical protein
VFNRAGEPIKDFRGAWKEACKIAEVPELKFHDLRRTAVRNMRRAGVPQIVRMRIPVIGQIPWSGVTTSYNSVSTRPANSTLSLAIHLQISNKSLFASGETS